MKSKKVNGKYNARYRVILEKNELCGFTATVPALPPVVSQGDTLQEAIDNVREAIELYIEFMISKGEKIPVEPQMTICDVEINAMK